MIYIIFFTLYFLIALLIIFQLILYGARPTKTLAWLLAIFTIPIGGILLYIILGRNRRKQKLYGREKFEEITEYLKKIENQHTPVTSIEYNEHNKLIHMITKNCGSAPSTENNVTLLKNGYATFIAIFNALQAAKHFIHLEYYIFEEGKLADELLELFKHKVKDGVMIRILYDGIGSRSLSRTYIKKLKKIGVEIYSFLPIRFGQFLSSVNYRNHRKIIVIDNKIAFTGGINVSDKYVIGDPTLGIWHDMHLQIEGPAVYSLQAIFLKTGI
ncbi:hypothetical protein GCM10022393_10790 [Aquimarina addita]|uniref:PLD phosphodiesterase domain-containing protein n=1 Tax=Aquimarina addita TaxID=870485 RepID=A0ABP7XFP5_9FLAO